MYGHVVISLTKHNYCIANQRTKTKRYFLHSDWIE